MDDFDVQGKERELDELLSEVKSLLEEDEPLREDPMEDAGLQDEASEGPMTADDVNIDFEKFYDDAAGFPVGHLHAADCLRAVQKRLSGGAPGGV